ncbi:NotI family restriction endonuclease [Pseudofrankia sp. DC12]|uniref:NotI family restriction endonuclease n=1 Tax=Pseudofrankia sp. DC12 TaxID=683315 RepID=UPI0005F82E70|nr:NotI family restriction endonuclease [Pseudofrankia sp. DC12]
MTDEAFYPLTSTPNKRPHLAEWHGHRVFPIVAAHPTATADQKDGRCPFLSEIVGSRHSCVKADNSKGVCSISAESNGHRQDWLVCPYRALDETMLEAMTRRLFSAAAGQPVAIRPASTLSEDQVEAILTDGTGTRVFCYFQDKLGGEISLSKTAASPEISFDITLVELLLSADGTQVRLGRYGIIELQTTDTHGTYKLAVEALRGALDLHPRDFPAQVAANQEWAGRRVEGPNISNVFKRTFYQVAFKFQVTRRDTSVGCILSIPRPVWDSWQPFLGKPDLHQQPDGTWRLLDDHSSAPPNWIYVFDIAEEPAAPGWPAPIEINMIIGTDAQTLSRAALDVAPGKAIENSAGRDAVLDTLSRRLRQYLPGLVPGSI